MTLKGSCHCGATQFEIAEAPAKVARCTCSFCSKRGALWAYYSPEQFNLTTARDRVSTPTPKARMGRQQAGPGKEEDRDQRPAAGRLRPRRRSGRSAGRQESLV